MNDQQWRDRLRNRLADYEQPEPPGLWEEVERAMAANRPTATPLVPPRGRILRRAGLSGVAAAMIAVMIWVGRVAFDETETATDTIVENPVQTTVPAGEQGAVESVPALPSSPPSPPSSLPNEPVVRPVVAAKHAQTNEPVITPDTVDVKSSADHPAEEPEPAPTQIDRAADHEKGRFDNGNVFARNEPVKSRKSRSNGWSARILASSAPGSGAKKLQGGYGTLSDAVSAPASIYPSATFGDNAMTDILLLNRDEETYTETRHNLPVRAGLMVNYGLTGRLGIESGVTYTYLASRLKSGSEQYYYQTRQSLHYLGIPLNINYSLWRSRLLSVYVSGGGMVEWNVAGSASTEYMSDGRAISKENRSVRVEEPQWSVNASVGLQLNFSRRVGIFADPGVSYRFANGSPVETIYRKTPLNFDLTFGLRISFEK